VNHPDPAWVHGELPDEFFQSQSGDRQQKSASAIGDQSPLDPCGYAIKETHPFFPNLPDPEPVRHAMHGKNIGMEYPVMGVDEIEILAGNGSIGEKSETQGGQKPWKSEHRNKMKRDITGNRFPLIGKNVNLITGILGDFFR
jgi:hypothetical protein